jgi:hypothetical protein
VQMLLRRTKRRSEYLVKCCYVMLCYRADQGGDSGMLQEKLVGAVTDGAVGMMAQE